MAERSSYAAGTPCWVDLATADPDASARFYGGLFGWEAADAGDPEQTRGYRFFTRDGKRLCGFGPPGPGEPPSWRTFVSVQDAEATARRVPDAGGEVLLEPMDVMEEGRIAVFADPEQAVFAVWQPGEHAGAELVNEPGTLSWSELNTRDPVAAKAFYGSVFGWDAKDQPIGPGDTTYTQWMLGDDAVGGMIDLRGRVPEQVPTHWMAYFTVEACGPAVEKAAELGAELKVGPVELPIGWFAVLGDPQGAHFALFEGAAGPAGPA